MQFLPKWQLKLCDWRVYLAWINRAYSDVVSRWCECKIEIIWCFRSKLCCGGLSFATQHPNFTQNLVKTRHWFWSRLEGVQIDNVRQGVICLFHDILLASPCFPEQMNRWLGPQIRHSTDPITMCMLTPHTTRAEDAGSIRRIWCYTW